MSFLEWTQALGSIGEFIGALAVVATLIYLAIQVKYTKASLDAHTSALNEDRKLALVQTYQTRAGLSIQALLTTAHNEAWHELMIRMKEDGFDSLTEAEKRHVRSVCSTDVIRLDALYFARQQGFLDDEYYEGTFVVLILTNRFALELMDVPSGSGWRPSFAAEVKRILDEDDGTRYYSKNT